MDQTHPLASIRHFLVGDRAFYRRTISILVPIIIQDTVTNVVNLLDNVMVGQVGTLQMSAVAIVNQLLFIFNLCIFGGLAGAGIFCTQFAGAQDYNGVRHCFRVKWIIGLAMFGIAAVVFTAAPGQLVSLYLAEGTEAQAAADTLRYGLDYFRIMVVGLLPFAISQVYASTLREMGETKLPMFASVTAILVNLVFNYLLIFGHGGFPKMGVVGAAAATVLSRFVELAIVVCFTHMHSARFPFIQKVYRSFHIPVSLLLNVARRGLPLLVNEFLWSAGMAMLTQCYSVRGLQVVAAFNIASTVGNLFNVMYISTGGAVAIMVGQALGAGEPDQARDTAWRLIAFSVEIGIIMGAVMALFSPLVPKIYNTEPEVRQMATEFLYVVCIMMPFYAFSHDCYFTLRSGGRTIITFLFDSAFTWAVNVPLAFCLANFTSLPIVPLYFLVQATECLKCLVGGIMVKKGIWIRNIISAEKGSPQEE